MARRTPCTAAPTAARPGPRCGKQRRTRRQPVAVERAAGPGPGAVRRTRGEVAIDPFDSAHAMYGYRRRHLEPPPTSPRRTPASPTHWSVGASGIEETAVLATALPHRRRPLDQRAWATSAASCTPTSTPRPPRQLTHPRLRQRHRAWTSPRARRRRLVRVGSGGKASNNVFGAVSSDGGNSWTPFADQAGSTQRRRHGGDLRRRRHPSCGRRRTWRRWPPPITDGTLARRLPILPPAAWPAVAGRRPGVVRRRQTATCSTPGTRRPAPSSAAPTRASAGTRRPPPALPAVPSWQTSQAVAVHRQCRVTSGSPPQSGLYRSSRSSGWNWSRVDATTVSAANSIVLARWPSASTTRLSTWTAR